MNFEKHIASHAVAVRAYIICGKIASLHDLLRLRRIRVTVRISELKKRIAHTIVTRVYVIDLTIVNGVFIPC